MRPRHLALIGALLVAINVVGWLDPGTNLLWVRRILYHPFLTAFALLLAVLALCVDRIPRRWLRVVAVTVTTLAIVGLAAVGLLTLLFSGTTRIAEDTSPSGTTTARIEESCFIMCSYEVVLRSNRGLATRENTVHHFDADEESSLWFEYFMEYSVGDAAVFEPPHEVPTIEFVDDETIDVFQGNTRFRVVFEPDSLEVRSVSCDAAPTEFATGDVITYSCHSSER